MLEVVSRPILPHRVPSTELLRAGSFRIELIDRYRQQKGASRTRIFLNNFLRAGHLLRVLQGCPRAPVGVTSCCGPRPRTAPLARSGAGLAFWGVPVLQGSAQWLLQRVVAAVAVDVPHRHLELSPNCFSSDVTRDALRYHLLLRIYLGTRAYLPSTSVGKVAHSQDTTGKADAMNAMRPGRQMKCATQCNGTGQSYYRVFRVHSA